MEILILLYGLEREMGKFEILGIIGNSEMVEYNM